MLVGFALLGSPYAILLGLLAGVLEFIPLVGPLVVAAVAVMLAALHDPMLALWTAVFLTVLRVVEDYVIYPRLIGRSMALHPLAVIVAVACALAAVTYALFDTDTLSRWAVHGSSAARSP